MRMSRNPTNIPGRSNSDYQSGDNLSLSVRFYSGTSGSYQMPFSGQRQSSPYHPTGLSREDHLVKNQQSQTMSCSYQSMSSQSSQAPFEHSWSPQGMHSHTQFTSNRSIAMQDSNYSCNECGQKFTDGTLLETHFQHFHTPQFTSHMSIIKAGSDDDLRKHFVEQAYQPHLRTDNTISFMDATKLKQPISSVRPAQSTFQPGMTAVACNLRCHCGNEFSNESDLQIHIQKSHVSQFELQMSTVNASKGQEFTELIGQVL